MPLSSHNRDKKRSISKQRQKLVVDTRLEVILLLHPLTSLTILPLCPFLSSYSILANRNINLPLILHTQQSLMRYTLPTAFWCLWPLKLIAPVRMAGEDSRSCLLFALRAVSAYKGVVALPRGLVKAALCLVLLLALVDVLQDGSAVLIFL